MTISYIPSPKNEKEKFDISIEDQQFSIEYSYNPRDDFWYFTLIKDSVKVIENNRMTMGYNFGENYLDFPLTLGNLTLYSPQGYEDGAHKSNFGKTVFLVYQVEDNE